ncbi:MAG TPA: YndJ family transporter [Opitutaceae bacterium]
MNTNAPRIPEWLIPTAGGAVWGITVALSGVDDLRGFAWSGALLTFAALVVVPLVLRLADEEGDSAASRRLLKLAMALQFPAALLLAVSVATEQGFVALLLAAPWIAVTAEVALAGIAQVAGAKSRSVAGWCRAGGLVYFAVGGAWVAADRIGAFPLGFGMDIVQLTAVHFHYAGLALPVLAGCVLREFPRSRSASLAGFGVLAGVPMVAVGISCTQLGGSELVEVVVTTVLAISGMIVALFQARLALESRWPRASRILWAVAAVSLAFGMTLALLYGIRSLAVPLPWLGIPWMRALHGTANAIGFCLCAAIGWRLAAARRDSVAA